MVFIGLRCQGPGAVLQTSHLEATRALAGFALVGYALRLRGVRVQGQLGVTDAERARAQELLVDVDLELEAELYPSADELARAADYAEVVKVADESARQRPYRLLETFALGVARRLVEQFFGAKRVRVAVTKASVPVAPTTDEARVEVTLARAVA